MQYSMPFSSLKINATILVVDDNSDNLTLVRFMLKDRYSIKIANCGVDALKIVQSESPPDLVLLDVMMPDMDGYETCRQMKENSKTKNIPVIFLTANTGQFDENYGFKIGAIDYITKPISPSTLLARVEAHLANECLRSQLFHNNEQLALELSKQSVEIDRQLQFTMYIINFLMERVTQKKEGYSERLQKYVFLLCQNLRTHHRFSHYLNSDNVISLLSLISPLYYIGNVLMSTDKNSSSESLLLDDVAVFHQYPLIGYDLISKAEQKIGYTNLFVKIAKEIVYYHNEKWNGTGYPEMLSEDNIPISARIIAVAITYDAMSEQSINMSHQYIVNYIKGEKGGKFDPEVVNVFLELQSEFKKISNTA